MKKRWPRLVLSGLITALILFLFLRRTPLGELKKALAALPLAAILIYILFSLLGTLLRVWRYHLLLSRQLRLRDLFLITLVQNFAMDLLPARSAALVFYAYFTRERGVVLSESASSFVMAVFWDAVAVVLLLAPALIFVRSDQPLTSVYLGLLVILLISLIVVLFSHPLLRWLRRFAWFKRLGKLDAMAAAVEEYLARHVGGGERMLVLLISFLIKLAKYLSLFTLFVALVGHRATLPLFFLFSVGIAGAELSSYLPVQGLAGFGTWEAAFMLAARQLSIPVENPFLTALVMHLVTQLWEYGIGVAAFLFLSMRGKVEK